MLEGDSNEAKTREISEGTQKAGEKFSKSALNVVVPFIRMAVGAKSKNPVVGQATAHVLKSRSAGRSLSLTDLHSNGLRLKVM